MRCCINGESVVRRHRRPGWHVPTRRMRPTLDVVPRVMECSRPARCLVTNDFVVDETLTLLRFRLGLIAAEKWLEQVDWSSRPPVGARRQRPLREGAPGVLPVSRGVYPAQRRGMTFTDRIEVNPRVMLGKPVIRGTRIPVELILRKLGEGASEADVLNAYPQLTREDIQAAMRYAADTLAHEEVVFIGKGSAERRD
jgi:uncharacterized protein (DUF433 family)